MTTTTYPVKGMSCEHCVNAVTSDGPLAEDAVSAALEEAGGYQLTSD